MILRTKLLPLDARKNVMGFRGKRGDRSCFYCGTTDETNIDKEGKLQTLTVRAIDGNLSNTRSNNHVYVCSRPGCKR